MVVKSTPVICVLIGGLINSTRTKSFNLLLEIKSFTKKSYLLVKG
ncbi:hypothetical protein ES703_41396 [subsurface metagenome]